MSTLAAASPTIAQPADQDPNILTHSMFLDTMKAMREHYQSSPLTSFTLIPGQISAVVDVGHLTPHAAPVQNGKALLDKVLANGKTGLAALAKNQQDLVQKQANALHAKAKPTPMDLDHFKSQVNAGRINAKQQVGKVIDKTYDDYIAAGTAHPELQSGILHYASMFASVAMSVFNEVSKFIITVVHLIASAADFLGKVGEQLTKFGSVVGALLSIF